jgi:hypothetical protein
MMGKFELKYTSLYIIGLILIQNILRVKKFKFIGPLTLVPYCMDYEENQVISFMCLQKNPNCIALLLNNGVIYHCILIPNCKSAGYESINVLYIWLICYTAQVLLNSINAYNFKFNEETSGDFNGEAFLFVYESIRLDESSDFSSVKFVKGLYASCVFSANNSL